MIAKTSADSTQYPEDLPGDNAKTKITVAPNDTKAAEGFLPPFVMALSVGRFLSGEGKVPSVSALRETAFAGITQKLLPRLRQKTLFTPDFIDKPHKTPYSKCINSLWKPPG